MSAYSKTPLIKKLGFKPPLDVLVIDAPADYRSWLGALPAGVDIVDDGVPAPRAVHLFTDRRARLDSMLPTLRRTLEPDGFVWISWPKKASKVVTDVTEDVIREVALPLGFVDIKVCAVSDIWSGLKLVIRKSERSGMTTSFDSCGILQLDRESMRYIPRKRIFSCGHTARADPD